LIFISGVKRIVGDDGELGLHRPFLATTPQSREVVQKQVPQMLSMVKSYISEMGITDAFYQRMVNTEPSRMVIYSGDQYKRIVPENDAVYEETEIAWEARRHGLTTMELRNRNQGAESSCKGVHDVGLQIDCEEAIRWGLSNALYRERKEKAGSCNLTSEERASLRLTPRRQLSENPLIIRREDCVRNIMLDQQ
jgi:hypothetical protein